MSTMPSLTIPCPHCGRPNRTGARFCAECGAALPDAQAAPQAGVETRTEAQAEAQAETGAETGTETGTEAAAADPLPPDPLLGPLLGPAPDPLLDPLPETDAGLEAGAWIAGRFYVRGAASDAAGRRVYEVEDHGVCPACGAVPAVTAAEEPYCTECGAYLLAPALRWPLRRLAELDGDDGQGADDDGELHDGELHWTAAGRAFALLAEGGAAAADAADPAREPGGEMGDAAPAVTLLAGLRTDAGIERAGRPNEDSLFALTLAAPAPAHRAPHSRGLDSAGLDSLGLYIVADGMGGHSDGEIASRTACHVISAEVLRGLGLFSPEKTPSLSEKLGVYGDLMPLLEGAMREANRRIYTAARAAGSNMGSTAVAALIRGGLAVIANVGDSRAYLWRGGELRPISADHSHVFTLLQKGLIDEDALYTHPRRNEIYRSLGAGPAVEVDCFAIALRPDDLLLLCSDGLWEMLRGEGIADVLLLNLRDPQVICDELVRRANGAGGEDNISVIAVAAVGAQLIVSVGP